MKRTITRCPEFVDHYTFAAATAPATRKLPTPILEPYAAYELLKDARAHVSNYAPFPGRNS